MTTLTLQKATLGMGCFWCSEAIYQNLKGIKKVTPGYAGGMTKNPTYDDVCSGKTGHAEVIQLEFEPKEITYEDILSIFWRLHDPTTLNKQGADVGTQYRSVIFYHDDAQKKIAEKTKEKAQHGYTNPIVTSILPYENFYEAEDYHKNYFRNNQNNPYCRFVIKPKLQKL